MLRLYFITYSEEHIGIRTTKNWWVILEKKNKLSLQKFTETKWNPFCQKRRNNIVDLTQLQTGYPLAHHINP